MDPRSRRRRNWIIFWLAVPGIPILAYVALAFVLSLTVNFNEPIGR
jgi:hypothetical protein